MLRVAIYARFSSQLQKDSSIEDQVRDCRARAEREGWQVTQVFSDYAISGAVRDRPGLNALVDHVAGGHATLVLAEAIDRISRDQEDLASIHKRITFLGGRIVTLSEGAVDELQIGFKGTMASLFRKDLADKIRRGQRGRIAAGRTPGGVVYGYRKIHQLDARGEAERGLREIDPEQAAIVRRVVAEYLAGESPLAIARRLNAEGVPSPSGAKWNVSAINGDAVRGSGILCNPIYAGQLVYNRTTMVRDPDSRKRVPRANPPEQWVVEDVPHLAIIDAASWAAVRARKAEWEGWSYARQVRPKKLLSGLVTCGQCGGDMVVIGDGKWGCANARKRGTCSNRRTMDNPGLERRVLAGLEKELLSPAVVDRAVKAYRDQRQLRAREEAGSERKAKSRVGEIDRQIERLVGAIANGAGDVPEVVAKLREAREERAQIEQQLAETDSARVIALHPGVAESYRKAVAQLTQMLAGDAANHRRAREGIRALLNQVILTPIEDGKGMSIEIEGRLAALMDGPKAPTRRAVGTVVVVAEEGLEPPTRGL